MRPSSAVPSEEQAGRQRSGGKVWPALCRSKAGSTAICGDTDITGMPCGGRTFPQIPGAVGSPESASEHSHGRTKRGEAY